MTALLPALALATGALHIRAEYRGPRAQVYVLKPLTTGLILCIALLATAPVSPQYQKLIVLGLAFSLAGDVFLMLPSDRFLAGLFSFLVAHLLYIAAFSSSHDPSFAPGALAPFALSGVAAAFVLWPYLGRMRVPATVYVSIILAMGWRAAEQWQASGEAWAALALAGAVLFAVSDLVLAIKRFRSPFHSAQLVVLSTYYTAQLLIALSVTGA
jgi:uncharacterized membrane protein YhhN